MAVGYPLKHTCQSMLRVYIFDEYSNSRQNGIGTYLRNLRAGMKDIAEVTMLSFNDDVQFFTRETVDGVQYYRFPHYCNGAFLYNAEIGLTILRTLIRDSPENVFLLNYFPCNILLKELRRHYPLSKTVFVIHDHLWTDSLKGDDTCLKNMVSGNGEGPGKKSVMHRVKQEQEMYSLADAVVCLNHETRDLLSEVHGQSEQRLFVIPNGIDIDVANTNKGIERKNLFLQKEEKVFLYVGRTVPSKGINDTLITFNKIIRRFPEARLVVLGQAFDIDKFSVLCPDAIPRITFTGMVTPDKISKWYAAAEFGLMPSYYEQCSYAGIEMMAHGLPVVASDAYGTRTMFRDGYNAIVAHIGDRDNPEEYRNNLADAMAKAIEMDETLYATMSANARECYKKNYTLDNMREGYLRMFDKLAEGQEKHQAPNAASSELPMRDRLYHLILHSCDVQDCGLLYGKMGIVLALATYARQHKQKAIEDYAGYLLKRTLHYVHKNMPWSFGKGLCGIVWGVEYLAQNGYMSIDTTEVCEELDRKIMEVSPLRVDDYSLENGLEGLMLYVNAHIKGGDKNPFCQSFMDEIKAVADEQYVSMPPSLQRQCDLFKAALRGEDKCFHLSLRQFVKAEEETIISWQDLSLSTGLAGLLMCAYARGK